MQKFCFLPFGVALLGATLVTGCVGSRNTALEEQVQLQNMQLRQMQPAQADALNQLQALRQELNEIKGQLDELKDVGGAKALAGRVSKHDTALRQVETSMAMDLNLGDPQQPRSVPPQPGSMLPVTPVPTQTSVPGSYGQPLVAAAAAPQLPEGVQPWGGSTPQTAQSAAQPPSESTWG